MNDDEIIRALRDANRTCSPHELAILLGELRAEPISQGAIVTFFKRAFPVVPLRTLLDVGAWHRASGGAMTDEEFDALLSPYLLRETDFLDETGDDCDA